MVRSGNVVMYVLILSKRFFSKLHHFGDSEFKLFVSLYFKKKTTKNYHVIYVHNCLPWQTQLSTLRRRCCTWRYQTLLREAGATSCLLHWIVGSHGGPRRTHSRSQQRSGAGVLQTHPEKQEPGGGDRDVPEPGWCGRAAPCGRATPGQGDRSPAGRRPRGGGPISCGSGEGDLWSAGPARQLLGDASSLWERRDEPERCVCSGKATIWRKCSLLLSSFINKTEKTHWFSVFVYFIFCLMMKGHPRTTFNHLLIYLNTILC